MPLSTQRGGRLRGSVQFQKRLLTMAYRVQGEGVVSAFRTPLQPQYSASTAMMQDHTSFHEALCCGPIDSCFATTKEPW